MSISAHEDRCPHEQIYWWIVGSDDWFKGGSIEYASEK
jgi:hypothetical protein